MKKKASITYPALLDVASGESHSLAATGKLLAGRSQDADLPLLDVSCSRRQFQIVRDGDRWVLENLSPRAPTLHQGQPVVAAIELAHGAVIQAGLLHFRFVLSDSTVSSVDLGHSPELLTEKTQAPPAMPVSLGDRTVVGPEGSSIAAPLTLGGPITIRGRMMIGRDQGRVQIHLDDPNVSRMHAQILA
ncbi:MAG: FHA domain-containing protein, partial [Acidobacteria bacterium]|nr:FHA domain-containing protein [Acidobacteriota bacterium]